MRKLKPHDPNTAPCQMLMQSGQGLYFNKVASSSPIQGRSIPNINAFQSVIHEKIFEDLYNFPYFFLLLGHKWGQPLYVNKSEFLFPELVSYQIWMKLAQKLLRRTLLKGKVNRRIDERTDDGRIAMEFSSPGSGEVKKLDFTLERLHLNKLTNINPYSRFFSQKDGFVSKLFL